VRRLANDQVQLTGAAREGGGVLRGGAATDEDVDTTKAPNGGAGVLGEGQAGDWGVMSRSRGGNTRQLGAHPQRRS
jgi:hypothetical protein